MPHIRYGDRNYKISNDEVLDYMTQINEALKNDTPLPLAFYETVDGQDYASTIFITRGVPLSMHNWDPPF